MKLTIITLTLNVIEKGKEWERESGGNT